MNGSRTPAVSASVTAGTDRAAKSFETSSVSHAPTATGAGPGISVTATAANAGTSHDAPSASAAQAPAVATIATRMITGASCAAAAVSLRGRARNVMPNALTKHATASPA